MGTVAQDVYHNCDPVARLGELQYYTLPPRRPCMVEGFEGRGLQRMVLRGERQLRGVIPKTETVEGGAQHPPRTVPDITFTFSHTTGINNTTAIFVPLTSYSPGSEADMNTSMALALLASRHVQRIMVVRPTQVVRWYGCVNDVFLPGLKVDLGEGCVGVDWRGEVGGVVGEERGVRGLREVFLRKRRRVGRGLCGLVGGRGERGGVVSFWFLGFYG